MPSQPRGRVLLVLVLCVAVLFLVLKYPFKGISRPPFPFSKQYSRSSKITQKAIGNDTLGFEKIFVINALWRTDRKDQISLAGSYSGISFDWIDGIDAETISIKALPPANNQNAHREMSNGVKGCWRAHMDAIHEIVRLNLNTALILEDTADWDFRIRSQLSAISPAVRKVQDLMTQSEKHSAKEPSPVDSTTSQVELARRSSLGLGPVASHDDHNDEPYGRGWDVLWLGHCSADLPPPSPHSPNRVILSDDATVPEPQYLRARPDAPLDPIGTLYPPHTRLIHQANTTRCMNAYAVTQTGARKILYEFGIREFSKPYDLALSDYCNGRTRAQKQNGGLLPMCIAVNPPVFGRYPDEKDGGNRTTGLAEETLDKGTRYVKWSVRMNLERLVRGEEGIIEQWPDTMKDG